MALSLALAGPAFAQPSGTWLSQSGETKIQFKKSGGTFIGTIVWTKSGEAVGKQMVHSVKKTGDNRWSGKLWNYQNGKTYTGKMQLLSASKMKLSGCVGPICRNQTWTKSN